MTAITALNVRLGMDASNFSQGADLARSEVNKVAATMRQSTPPAEKLKKDVDLLNKAFSESGRQSKEYTQALEFLRKKYGQIPDATAAAEAAAARMKQSIARLAAEEQKHDALLRRQTESLRGMKAETDKAATSNGALLSRVKMLVAAYLSFQGVKTGVKIASDMEQAAIAFDVMTGSAEAGQKTLSDLRKFAASTPITLPGAQQAARTLLGFGVEANRILPTLRMIGDVTGGNADRFGRLSAAFAKMSAAGRLMGDELNQMIDAGFNPLVEISRTTGVSVTDLRKRMEQGSISLDMVTGAFQSATSEGGRFFGMMDRMSKTAAGSYAQLISSIQELVAQVGAHLLPILASAAKSMESVVRATSGMISSFSKSQVELLAMVGAFTATVFIIPKIVTAITALVGAIKLMTKAQTVALAFGGPKGWAILAAGVAAAALAVGQVDKAFAGMAESADAAMGGEGAGKKTEAAAKAAAAAIAAQGPKISPLEKEFLSMEHSLNEQVKLANLGADAYARQQMYIKGMSIEQVQRIQQLKDELKFAEQAEDRQRKLAEAQKKQAEDRKRQQEEINAAFTKDVQQAMAAAKQHFEQERQRDAERRKAVSAGPSSIEEGSAGAAKFRADAINQRIGAAAVPVKPTPGEAEIARKTQELLIAQRAANLAQDKELKTMEALLVQFKENGFRRTR